MSQPRPQTRRQQWYGPEKRCPKCTEWWPADTEFFHGRPGGQLDSWCRACVNEKRQLRRSANA